MASFLEIRSYRIEDQAAVVALWKSCNLVVAQNDPVKDIQRKLAVNPEWFLIGEIEQNVVASCMAGYEGHRGWINYLAVSPGFRRQGIGKKMMQAAENMLKSVGCPKINLQVRSTNQPVIAFYRSIGFQVDAVISMGKRIEPDSG
jgi:ribosomal protein S18 acetylase RimI-like enzyme